MDKPKGAVDSIKISEQANVLQQERIDLLRMFHQVFNTRNGKKIIEHLDKYSHKNFPNYDNPNATYSKIGEQTLVEYIKALSKKKEK